MNPISAMNPGRLALSRRRMLGLAGAGAAAFALSSCAGTGSAGGGQEGDGTLKFWSNHPAGSKPLEEEIIAKWMEQNPDIPVELVDGGADYEELAQKFNAALAGGDLPDLIVASDVTWFNFALNEATTPLNDLWAEAGVDADSYVDTLREDYAFDGQHFGMPYCRSTNLLYLNTELLAEAGLPTDRGPETWQEFAEWAPQLLEANDGKAALAIPDGSNYLDWYFQGIIWTFGGAYSDEWTPTFTTPESLEAGEFLKKQVGEGHVEIATEAATSFTTGNAAAMLGSTGSLSEVSDSAGFEFITAYLPGPAPGAATGGAGVAVPNGISDERKLNAVKFADFLTNTENTIMFSQNTGYMPVRKDAVDHPDEQAYLEENPNFSTALDQLTENTAPQDYARVFVPGGGQRIGAALDRISIGQEDVSTVFEELQNETQEVIDRDITPLL